MSKYISLTMCPVSEGSGAGVQISGVPSRARTAGGWIHQLARSNYHALRVKILFGDLILLDVRNSRIPASFTGQRTPEDVLMCNIIISRSIWELDPFTRRISTSMCSTRYLEVRVKEMKTHVLSARKYECINRNVCSGNLFSKRRLLMMLCMGRIWLSFWSN